MKRTHLHPHTHPPIARGSSWVVLAAGHSRPDRTVVANPMQGGGIDARVLPRAFSMRVILGAASR